MFTYKIACDPFVGLLAPMWSRQSPPVVVGRVQNANSSDHLSGSAEESLYFVLANVAGHFSKSLT